MSSLRFFHRKQVLRDGAALTAGSGPRGDSIRGGRFRGELCG